MNDRFGVKAPDLQIMHCLALALIEINAATMKQLGIKPLPQPQKIKSEDMTEEQKKINEDLRSR